MARSDVSTSLKNCSRKATPPPTEAEREQFFKDVETSLRAIQFFKTRQVDLIMRTVRSLAGRALPDSRELSLIRAMALEVVRFMERTRP